MLGAAVISLALSVAVFAAGKIEIRGVIEPSPGQFAAVALHGQDFPFEDSTYSDPKGRFRFKNVEAGQYTVIVFVPGKGTSRRTVVVSSALADEKGRVAITIPFAPSGESMEAAGTVSLGTLSIPRKAKSEYAKAQKKLKNRDVDAAIAHLKRAVEIAPNYVAAWNNLGTIAYQSGRYLDAEKFFRTALRYEPGAYSPVVNLGGTLLSLNRYEEAVKYNEYAIKLRPDEALPNSQLGMNYYYLGRPEKALRYLNEAKRIDPNHFSHPQLLLSRIYAERQDFRQAAAELEDFITRHPDDRNADAARRWLDRIRQARRK